MIDEKMQYLSSQDNIDYYLMEEIGFTHKNYAYQNKLYEFFGKSTPSTFQEIFKKNAFSDNALTQIWAFNEDKPVALAIGIEAKNFKPVIFNGQKRGDILGQFHLYVKPEYRKIGIGKNMIQYLDRFFKPHENGFIFLQDDALQLKKHMQHHFAIPPDYKQTIANMFDSKNPDTYKMKY